MAEVIKRGGETWFATRRELFMAGAQVKVRASRMWLTSESPYHKMSEPRVRSLADFDVIHIRTDPPFTIEYYYTTLFAESVQNKTLVLNNPVALRDLNEKLAIFNFPEFITDSLVTYDANEGCDFVESLGGIAVAKELATCSSRGVTLLQDGRDNVCETLRRLTNSGIGPILIQRYLEKVTDGETRVTLIDGKPLGYMTKIPAQGNYLASMDFGASSASCTLNKREMEISLSVGAFLKERGVLFAALDIIDGHLSEINVTSPGLLKHTNQIMGVKLEEQLEDAV